MISAVGEVDSVVRRIELGAEGYLTRSASKGAGSTHASAPSST
jgi:hypothetical protein